jgi:hypothetical protein
LTDTTTGKEKEIGEAWDSLDAPGKKALMDGGDEPIRFSAAENAKVRRIGAELSERHIKDLDAKGLPASAVYKLMRERAEKAAKTSKSFWN